MIVEAENKVFKNLPPFVKVGFYGTVTGFGALGAQVPFQSTNDLL